MKTYRNRRNVEFWLSLAWFTLGGVVCAWIAPECKQEILFIAVVMGVVVGAWRTL